MNAWEQIRVGVFHKLMGFKIYLILLSYSNSLRKKTMLSNLDLFSPCITGTRGAKAEIPLQVWSQPHLHGKFQPARDTQCGICLKMEGRKKWGKEGGKEGQKNERQKQTNQGSPWGFPEMNSEWGRECLEAKAARLDSLLTSYHNSPKMVSPGTHLCRLKNGWTLGPAIWWRPRLIL